MKKFLRTANHSAALLLAAGMATAGASSHREAPLITSTPKVDASDFYLFTSYESGREGFVTVVANYLPLQDPYGGPNYFLLDDSALYEIHFDNDGDALEDVTFQFRFTNTFNPLELTIGEGDNARAVAVPLLTVGQVDAGDPATLGNIRVDQTYTVTKVDGDRRDGTAAAVTIEGDGGSVFTKPFDHVGTKVFPDYAAYAELYEYPITIPGCATPGRVFVGQRNDPFVVNLGETFDLINTNPLGAEDGERDSLRRKNVTSIIMEIPKECLRGSVDDPVVGAWTTASVADEGAPGGFRQVSRLGQPLVNEVVIGVQDKDLFNTAEPMIDGALAHYVTNPTLPALIEILFGVPAPTAIPRQDLVDVFLLGVDGLNRPAAVTGSEMLRLNLDTSAAARGAQKRMGVIEGDVAGFPNGRRPGDDVVDIALRVVMGKLLSEEVAPVGQAPLTDGAYVDALMFSDEWPYLNLPTPGSPNSDSIEVVVKGSEGLEGFATLEVTYDAVAQQVTVPKVGLNRGFYRMELVEPGTAGDAELNLNINRFDGDKVILDVLKN